MAKTQTVSIVLQAVDRASSVVTKISNGFEGLKGKANDAANASGSMSNAIAFGMAKYNAAVGLAQAGIGKIQGMLEEGVNLQMQNMSAAQTFAAVSGQSFDQGAAFIDRMNASLSNSAATLPGATKDYVELGRSIQDNLIDAFKGKDKVLKDMKGFEGALLSISESYGVLSAASNVPVSNTAMGLSRALSGGSISELRQLQVFQDNPAILNEMEKRLQKVGAKDLKSLDDKARVMLIKDLGEQFVNSSFKKRASETADGLMQGFISSIFDPQSGVFGIMKDLDKSTSGVQSAFGSYNDLLKTLLGSGGLYEQVSGLLSDLGLSFDPMVLLRDGIVWLDGWIKKASEGVAWLRSFLGSGGDVMGGLQILLSNMGGGFDLATMGAQINSGIAWISGQMLGFLNTGFQAIAAWLAALQPTAGADIGAAVGIFAGNLVGNVINFIFGLDWASILLVIGMASIQLIGAIGAFIIGFTVTAHEHVTTALNNIRDGLLNGLTQLLQMIGQIIRTKLIEAGNAVKNAPGNIMSEIGYGISGTAQSAAEAVGLAPKYMGHIGTVPNAAGGFMGAIAREMSAMPSGASPIVANTSETILTPSMLKNLVTGSVAAGAGGGSAFAPSIVINGAGGDGEAIAQDVLKYLEIFFSEFTEGQLA